MSTRRFRILPRIVAALLAALSVLAAVLAGTAIGQDIDVGQPRSVAVDTTGLVPGGAGDVELTGIEPGETVSLALEDEVGPVDAVGNGTADPAGNATIAYALPADLEPGNYTIAVLGSVSALITTIPFSVAGDPTTPSPPATAPQPPPPAAVLAPPSPMFTG